MLIIQKNPENRKNMLNVDAYSLYTSLATGRPCKSFMPQRNNTNHFLVPFSMIFNKFNHSNANSQRPAAKREKIKLPILRL